MNLSFKGVKHIPRRNELEKVRARLEGKVRIGVKE